MNAPVTQPFKNKALKLFSDTVAMTLSVVPNNAAFGQIIMIDAALIDAEKSKSAGTNRYDWDNKVTTPLYIDGIMGFLLVGRRHREQYDAQSGSAVIRLTRQSNEYADKYPCVLGVLANKTQYKVRLTPGNTMAFLSMLAKAAAETHELDVADQMRLIDAFK